MPHTPATTERIRSQRGSVCTRDNRIATMPTNRAGAHQLRRLPISVIV